jgi:hypothetical protein
MIKKIAGIALSFGVAVAMAVDGYIVFFKNQQTSTASDKSNTETAKKRQVLLAVRIKAVRTAVVLEDIRMELTPERQQVHAGAMSNSKLRFLVAS